MNSTSVLYLVLLLFIIFGCFLILKEVFVIGPKRRKYNKIINLYNNSMDMSFVRVQKIQKILVNNPENQSYVDKHNYMGLYIVYNKTKKKYFVGADTYVFDALVRHLSGEGYSNLYRDVLDGDELCVRTIPYSDLDRIGYNDLELAWNMAKLGFKSSNPKYGYN